MAVVSRTRAKSLCADVALPRMMNLTGRPVSVSSRHSFRRAGIHILIRPSGLTLSCSSMLVINSFTWIQLTLDPSAAEWLDQERGAAGRWVLSAARERFTGRPTGLLHCAFASDLACSAPRSVSVPQVSLSSYPAIRLSLSRVEALSAGFSLLRRPRAPLRRSESLESLPFLLLPLLGSSARNKQVRERREWMESRER